MMPKTEEEGRAWLAINSIDDNVIKRVFWLMPIVTGVYIVAFSFVVAGFATGGMTIGFWGGAMLLGGAAGGISMIVFSVKLRRKGVDHLFENDHQEPLKLLSGTERRNYRVLQWITIFLSAILTLGFTLLLLSGIKFNALGWSMLAGGVAVTACLGYLLVQRTRTLVRKITSQLREQDEPAPARGI